MSGVSRSTAMLGHCAMVSAGRNGVLKYEG